MKPKKKARCYLMPNWALKRIKAIADELELSQTEVLLRCLDAGSKYIKKMIKSEINPKFDWKETEEKENPDEPSKTNTTNSNQDLERCPGSETNDNLEENIRIAKAKWVDIY